MRFEPMGVADLDAALRVAQEYAVNVRSVKDVLGVAACEDEDGTLLVMTFRRPGSPEHRDAVYEAQIGTFRNHPHVPLDFSVRTVPSTVKSYEDLLPYLPMHPLLLDLNVEQCPQQLTIANR